MKGKSKATPIAAVTPTEAQVEAERIQAARQAKKEKKAAAAAAKALATKPVIGKQSGGHKNPFSFPGSTSKATSIPRAIISRARGGRSR